MRGCGGGGGRRRDSVKDEQHRPDVDIVLHGSRRTVLVGNADLPRRWRVHESFPGQVRAFLLAEYGGADPRPDPMVEGLQPDQFELDSLRLSNLRKRERGPASEPFPAYRSTDLLACEAARPSHRARGWFALGIPKADWCYPGVFPRALDRYVTLSCSGAYSQGGVCSMNSCSGRSASRSSSSK